MRSLNGQIVRIIGTVADTLQMEMFGAFKKSQTAGSNEDLHLFTEVGADPQALTEDYVFYERNISLTYLDRTPYSPIKKKVDLKELYGSNYEELNTKFNSGTHDIPFFVKTYATPDSLMLVNKHVEIIGFLYFPQEFEEIEKEKQIYFQNEIDPVLHPFFTPIIHAVRVNHVNPFHGLSSQMQVEKIGKTQVAKLIDFVVHVARGDSTFGKLMLYSIISLVTGKPYNTPIDFISLNLYNLMNDKIVQDIKRAINLLAPRPVFQQSTILELSKNRLFGKKNYEMNCIDQGLPLEDGTTLVLDETQLETGTLHEVGVKNVTMLSNIIGLQKKFYDFDYCPFEADCNVTVIGLSRGKSILEFEYKVDFSLTRFH